MDDLYPITRSCVGGKKQTIKFEVLETRDINRDSYMEAAYWDKKNVMGKCKMQ